MENENADAQVDVIEQEEDTSVEEVEESADDTESEEEVSLSKEKFKAMQRKAIAYDAMKKAPKEQPKQIINNNPQLSDELKLIARGLSDEEIEQAKVIAKGKDLSLNEAVKDSLFLTFQSDFKAREKRENAKLGASKGSGESKPEVTGLQSGSSREEHMKAFEKLSGK